MIEWKKIEKRVGPEGTTVIYHPANIEAFLTIESRKRHIPHANGIGTWDHTTYHILRDGVEVGKQYSLSDAKYLAENMIEEEL